MKPSDLIHVLENKDAPAISARTPEGELLLTMVAKVFFADRTLDDKEVRLFARLSGYESDTQAYVTALAAKELDYQKMAELFPDAQDRDDIITLAEHAVWGDDDFDSNEWDIVDRLVDVLGIERA